MSKDTVPILDSTRYMLGSLGVREFFKGLESVKAKFETIAQ